jgi:hypothetical protein
VCGVDDETAYACVGRAGADTSRAAAKDDADGGEAGLGALGELPEGGAAPVKHLVLLPEVRSGLYAIVGVAVERELELCTVIKELQVCGVGRRWCACVRSAPTG